MTDAKTSPHAHLRAQLDARLKALIKRVDAIELDLRQPSNPDWQENVTERENDEVLEGLDTAGLDEIVKIRSALLRMDEGVYGMCVRCGEDIAPRRLEVLPSSTDCIECARAAAA